MPHAVRFFGLSVVELTCADGTDDYFARQVVLEKLRDVALRAGVTAALGPLSTGISEFDRVVQGGGDDMNLREIQDWIIAPRLAPVEGVADVVTFGGVVKEYSKWTPSRWRSTGSPSPRSPTRWR